MEKPQNLTEKPKKKKKGAGGRPPEFTDDVVKKLEEAFSIDASVEEACFYANISRQTFYNNVKDGEEATKRQQELFDRLTALRNRPVLKARQTVVKSLDTPGFAFEYLRRKRKHEFGDSTDITSDGKPVGVIYLPQKNGKGLEAKPKTN